MSRLCYITACKKRRPDKKPNRLLIAMICLGDNRLSLGELGCTACALEAVFLSFLHSGVSGKETCLLEGGTESLVVLKKSTSDAVADSACLAGDSAAADAANDVKLIGGAGKSERLTDDELESLKAEIIVYISAIDGDLAGAGINADSGNGALSAAGAVEIRI